MTNFQLASFNGIYSFPLFFGWGGGEGGTRMTPPAQLSAVHLLSAVPPSHAPCACPLNRRWSLCADTELMCLCNNLIGHALLFYRIIFYDFAKMQNICTDLHTSDSNFFVAFILHSAHFVDFFSFYLRFGQTNYTPYLCSGVKITQAGVLV